MLRNTHFNIACQQHTSQSAHIRETVCRSVWLITLILLIVAPLQMKMYFKYTLQLYVTHIHDCHWFYALTHISHNLYGAHISQHLFDALQRCRDNCIIMNYDLTRYKSRKNNTKQIELFVDFKHFIKYIHWGIVWKFDAAKIQKIDKAIRAPLPYTKYWIGYYRMKFSMAQISHCMCGELADTILSQSY
jgi:hypothetical protein